MNLPKRICLSMIKTWFYSILFDMAVIKNSQVLNKATINNTGIRGLPYLKIIIFEGLWIQFGDPL